MRFRFASQFGWWIPSEAEEWVDLEPWRGRWQRPILSHPHPRAYATLSVTCYCDGPSAAHGFALVLHCWDTVTWIFLPPQGCTSGIWLRLALDLLRHSQLVTLLSPVAVPFSSGLFSADENIQFQPKATLCVLTAKGVSTQKRPTALQTSAVPRCGGSWMLGSFAAFGIKLTPRHSYLKVLWWPNRHAVLHSYCSSAVLWAVPKMQSMSKCQGRALDLPEGHCPPPAHGRATRPWHPWVVPDPQLGSGSASKWLAELCPRLVGGNIMTWFTGEVPPQPHSFGLKPSPSERCNALCKS